MVKEVKVFCLNVNEFTLFSGGGGYPSLPLHISRSHSCILIGNSCNDKCFLKCVIAALCGKGKKVGQWCGEYEKIMKGIEELSSSFLTFPDTSKVIKKFEHEWPVSINVYGYSGVIYPHYLSSTLLQPDRWQVNLLLHSGHFFLIRNMSTWVTHQCKTNKQKCHVCPSCLLYFICKDRYEMHIHLCKKDGTQYVFPEGDEAELGFSSFNNMVNAPLVIYADFETMIFKEEMVRRGKVRSKHRHVPISIGALTVCKDRGEFGHDPFPYTGLDCIDILIGFLNREQQSVHEKYDGVSVLCGMTDQDCKYFRSAHVCEMCGQKFGQDPMLKKVENHCHISGMFRYVLCSSCNLTRAKRPFQVNIFFHGLSNYDSHFLIQKLGEYRKFPMNVIPRNMRSTFPFLSGV